MAVDQPRGVISFLLTPGQAGDSSQMIGVLERIRVMHPGGRAWLAGHGIRATIPVRPTKPPTARLDGAAVADHPRSMRKHTRTGTPSNAA